MPTQCCVPKCRKRKGHAFPMSDPVRVEAWRVAVRRNKWQPNKHSVVCKDHFDMNDYEVKTTYGTVPLQMRLKKSAVPHIFKWTKRPTTPAVRRRSRASKLLKQAMEAAANIGAEETVSTEENFDDFKMETSDQDLPNVSLISDNMTPIRSEDVMKQEVTVEAWRDAPMRVKRQSFTRAEHTSNHQSQQLISGVKYAEIENTDDDEFIFCPDCNLEHLGDCPIHGSLIIIKDREAPADGSDPYRAENTLPPCLTIKESSIPNAGRGVFSAEVIPKGVRFGPYEGVHVDGKDTASRYAWEIHKDGGLSHYIDAFDQSLSNWMRFVNCPHLEDQQNLMAFQYEGVIYYCTIIEIPQNTELLVSYGNQLIRIEPSIVTGEIEQHIGIQKNNPTTQASEPRLQEQPQTNMNKIKLQQDPTMNGTLETFNNLPEHAKETSSVTSDNLPGHEKESPSNASHDVKLEQLDSENQSDDQTHWYCTHCDSLFTDEVLFQKHQKCEQEIPSQPRMLVEKQDTIFSVADQQTENGKLNRSESIPTNDHTYSAAMVADVNEQQMAGSYEESTDCEVNQTDKIHSKQDMSCVVVDTGEKPYTCYVCSKGFTKESVLRIHQRTHTGEKPYTCSVCGKGFTQSSNLHSHWKTHAREKPYMCDVCGKGFMVYRSFRQHQITHTTVKPYTCSVCGKGFRFSNDLDVHQITHTRENPYSCGVCGKRFSLSGSLHEHQRIHTGDEGYTCNVCGKEFTKASDLHTHQRTHIAHTCSVCGKGFNSSGDFQTHQRTHTPEKPYTCNVCAEGFSRFNHLQEHQRTHTAYTCSVCGKAFSQSGQLHVHQRTHTGEKPFTCSVCGKAFTQSRYLQTHQRTHTGEKPYTCSVCGKAFTQSHYLQTHQRTHTGEKPYTCSVCGKAFTRTRNLQKHQRTHTGENPYTCSVCGKGFTQSSNLYSHQKTHAREKQYTCSVCRKAFTRTRYLQTHQRTHTGEKPYICSVCGKAFTQSSNLYSHQKTHTGEKPYTCSVCGKAFTRANYLKTHQRKHTDLRGHQKTHTGE